MAHKDIPEADAPDKCPERILDLLTPTDDPRVRERRTELVLRWNDGGREPLLLRDEALDDGRAARLVFDPAAGPPPGGDDRMPWFVAVDGEEWARRFRTEREAQAEIDALVVRFGLGGGPRAPR